MIIIIIIIILLGRKFSGTKGGPRVSRPRGSFHIYIYIYICISLSLSIYIYIYIHTYVWVSYYVKRAHGMFVYCFPVCSSLVLFPLGCFVFVYFLRLFVLPGVASTLQVVLCLKRTMDTAPCCNPPPSAIDNRTNISIR